MKQLGNNMYGWQIVTVSISLADKFYFYLAFTYILMLLCLLLIQRQNVSVVIRNIEIESIRRYPSLLLSSSQPPITMTLRHIDSFLCISNQKQIETNHSALSRSVPTSVTSTSFQCWLFFQSSQVFSHFQNVQTKFILFQFIRTQTIYALLTTNPSSKCLCALYVIHIINNNCL